VAALTQDREHRRFPRFLQIVGVAGCATLVATLPATSVAIGGAVFAVGILIRWLRLRIAAAGRSA
jgi:APA family basic amino acid/polyamine antiporter